MEPGWNLGGTYLEVPPLSIPLYKGIPAKKVECGTFFVFPLFYNLSAKTAVPCAVLAVPCAVLAVPCAVLAVPSAVLAVPSAVLAVFVRKRSFFPYLYMIFSIEDSA